MDNKDIQQLHFEALSARLDRIELGIKGIKVASYLTLFLLVFTVVGVYF